MTKLTLETRDQQTSFRPGDEIHGAAFWKSDSPPKSVDVRLFWRTRGKGTEDVQVVDTITFFNPTQEEARPFTFRAPESPYSFSGKLISLIWGLELVAEPGNVSTSFDLTISPTAREIVLGQK